jgi:hypothetical protein
MRSHPWTSFLILSPSSDIWTTRSLCLRWFTWRSRQYRATCWKSTADLFPNKRLRVNPHARGKAEFRPFIWLDASRNFCHKEGDILVFGQQHVSSEGFPNPHLLGVCCPEFETKGNEVGLRPHSRRSAESSAIHDSPRRDTKTPSLCVSAFSCPGPSARRPARILAQAPVTPRPPARFGLVRAFNRAAARDSHSLSVIFGAEKQPGSLIAEKWPVGFVNWPLPLYRSVPLVKDATGRLKQKTRRFRSSLTMLTSQSAALRNSRSAELSLRFQCESNGAAESLTE